MATKLSTEQMQDFQQIDAELSNADAANRLLIMTGRLELTVSARASGMEEMKVNQVFKVLVGPTLTHQEFIRATASASIISVNESMASVPSGFDYGISSMDADWDDESGQVELEVEVYARVSGPGNSLTIHGISFQAVILTAQLQSILSGPTPNSPTVSSTPTVTSDSSTPDSPTVSSTPTVTSDSSTPDSPPVPSTTIPSTNTNPLPGITLPSPRFLHGMVYDDARQVYVLFGGLAGSGPGQFLRDTWEFDGQTWKRFDVPGPSPRFSFGMAYYPSLRKVVLFGGKDANAIRLNDTWLWDGVNWQRVAPPVSPPARSDFRMTFDTTTNQVLVFGGDRESGLRDTWLFDGISWQSKQSIAPPDYFGRPIASGGQRTVICGSTVNPWVWDGVGWKAGVGSLPHTVSSDQTYMIWDNVLNQIVLLSHNDQGGTEAYSWNGAAWTTIPNIPAVPDQHPIGQSFLFDARTQTWVISGGCQWTEGTQFDPLRVLSSNVSKRMAWLKPNTGKAWAGNPNAFA